MSTIQLHGKSFEIFLPEALIQEKIAALANEINTDYAGKKTFVYCGIKRLLHVCFRFV